MMVSSIEVNYPLSVMTHYLQIVMKPDGFYLQVSKKPTALDNQYDNTDWHSQRIFADADGSGNILSMPPSQLYFSKATKTLMGVQQYAKTGVSYSFVVFSMKISTSVESGDISITTKLVSTPFDPKKDFYYLTNSNYETFESLYQTFYATKPEPWPDIFYPVLFEVYHADMQNMNLTDDYVHANYLFVSITVTAVQFNLVFRNVYAYDTITNVIQIINVPNNYYNLNTFRQITYYQGLLTIPAACSDPTLAYNYMTKTDRNAYCLLTYNIGENFSITYNPYLSLERKDLYMKDSFGNILYDSYMAVQLNTLYVSGISSVCYVGTPDGTYLMIGSDFYYVQLPMSYSYGPAWTLGNEYVQISITGAGKAEQSVVNRSFNGTIQYITTYYANQYTIFKVTDGSIYFYNWTNQCSNSFQMSDMNFNITHLEERNDILLFVSLINSDIGYLKQYVFNLNNLLRERNSLSKTSLMTIPWTKVRVNKSTSSNMVVNIAKVLSKERIDFITDFDYNPNTQSLAVAYADDLTVYDQTRLDKDYLLHKSIWGTSCLNFTQDGLYLMTGGFTTGDSVSSQEKINVFRWYGNKYSDKNLLYINNPSLKIVACGNSSEKIPNYVFFAGWDGLTYVISKTNLYTYIEEMSIYQDKAAISYSFKESMLDARIGFNPGISEVRVLSSIQNGVTSLLIGLVTLDGTFTANSPSNLAQMDYSASSDGLNSMAFLTTDMIDQEGNNVTDQLFGVVFGGYAGGLFIFSDLSNLRLKKKNGTAYSGPASLYLTISDLLTYNASTLKVKDEYNIIYSIDSSKYDYITVVGSKGGFANVYYIGSSKVLLTEVKLSKYDIIKVKFIYDLPEEINKIDDNGVLHKVINRFLVSDRNNVLQEVMLIKFDFSSKNDIIGDSRIMVFCPALKMGKKCVDNTLNYNSSLSKDLANYEVIYYSLYMNALYLYTPNDVNTDQCNVPQTYDKLGFYNYPITQYFEDQFIKYYGMSNIIFSNISFSNVTFMVVSDPSNQVWIYWFNYLTKEDYNNLSKLAQGNLVEMKNNFLYGMYTNKAIAGPYTSNTTSVLNARNAKTFGKFEIIVKEFSNDPSDLANNPYWYNVYLIPYYVYNVDVVNNLYSNPDYATVNSLFNDLSSAWDLGDGKTSSFYAEGVLDLSYKAQNEASGETTLLYNDVDEVVAGKVNVTRGVLVSPLQSYFLLKYVVGWDNPMNRYQVISMIDCGTSGDDLYVGCETTTVPITGISKIDTYNFYNFASDCMLQFLQADATGVVTNYGALNISASCDTTADLQYSVYQKWEGQLVTMIGLNSSPIVDMLTLTVSWKTTYFLMIIYVDATGFYIEIENINTSLYGNSQTIKLFEMQMNAVMSLKKVDNILYIVKQAEILSIDLEYIIQQTTYAFENNFVTLEISTDIYYGNAFLGEV